MITTESQELSLPNVSTMQSQSNECSHTNSSFNTPVLLFIQGGAFNQKNALSTFCRVPNAAWKAIANEYNSKDNVSVIFQL